MIGSAVAVGPEVYRCRAPNAAGSTEVSAVVGEGFLLLGA
jgi:hypothetical protein